MRVHRAAVVAFALVCPLVAHAGYGAAKWGMTPLQIKRLFPGGRTITVKPGEEMYRVSARPFDAAPAIATFAFHPVHKLNVISFEFPDGNVGIASEYRRRTRENAA